MQEFLFLEIGLPAIQPFTPLVHHKNRLAWVVHSGVCRIPRAVNFSAWDSAFKPFHPQDYVSLHKTDSGHGIVVCHEEVPLVVFVCVKRDVYTSPSAIAKDSVAPLKPLFREFHVVAEGHQVIPFSVLDGYYLWQEKLFRKLYDKVRKMNDVEVDFSMDTKPVTNQVDQWSKVVFSKTILIFHGTIVATIIIVMFIFIANIYLGGKNG